MGLVILLINVLLLAGFLTLLLRLKWRQWAQSAAMATGLKNRIRTLVRRKPRGTTDGKEQEADPEQRAEGAGSASPSAQRMVGPYDFSAMERPSDLQQRPPGQQPGDMPPSLAPGGLLHGAEQASPPPPWSQPVHRPSEVGILLYADGRP